MPVDFFADIRLNLTDSDLNKLDKQAAKAEKKLEQAKKTLQKNKGIFALPISGKTLPKGFDPSFVGGNPLKGGGAPKDLIRKGLKEEVEKQKGLLEGLLKGELGQSKASEALSLMRDPESYLIKVFGKAVPILGGLFAFVEVVKGIIDLLMEPGGPLDIRFRETVTTLFNALRTKQLQESIRQGYSQLIITTKAGSFHARDSYNSYRQLEQDRRDLERDFMVRRPSGY